MRLRLVRAQAQSGVQDSLSALTNRELAYSDVYAFIEQMENGSEKAFNGDFLGADLLPKLEDTSELEDM